MTMNKNNVVVGIDLGTTNSSIALVRDGVPRLVPVDGDVLLPSAVAVQPDGSILVGRAARNQRLVYPERTITSVKRRMGESTEIVLGDQSFSPEEISALILKRLVQAAGELFGVPVKRAVITVPAYFSDAQRTATKVAGEMAGLTVERIVNEPTAAALCYSDIGQEGEKVVMVYDLGGGTFDVSILRIGQDVTEVLASHGDTHLGGDDFDAALQARLSERFKKANDLDPLDDIKARVRLVDAAEKAKIALSEEVYAKVTLEHLMVKDGVSLHMAQEVSRHEYEDFIGPLLRKTLDSVHRAMTDAKLTPDQLDEVILVGGATRTPKIPDMLSDIIGLAPRMDVNPDTAVSLGAALLGARIAGEAQSRILVDVTPYSFGTSYLGMMNGRESPDCYKTVIRRNTPLPTHQSALFYTVVPGQESIDTRVFQGENPDARKNLEIGQFWVEGLDEEAPGGSPVVFEMQLDIDGILNVRVVERHTGLEKGVTIEDAFRKMTPEEIQAARERIARLTDDDADDLPGPSDAPLPTSIFEIPPAPESPLSEEERALWAKSVALLEKTEKVAAVADASDRGELGEMAKALVLAMQERQFDRMSEASEELADALFYLD
jgi:molecular chaperone DnaK